MRVLVTGAGGFVGSHLTERLLRAGHRVRALTRYQSAGSWGLLEPLKACPPERLEVFPGDVTDPGRMREAAAGCDCVVHLAALVAVPYSYHAPASYIAVNVMGTLNVLEAARQAGARRVVVASTSEVYGTAQYEPMDEVHPLCAQSPYAASKIAAEKLAESFYRSFDLPVVIVRLFNAYGPRQSGRAVIPALAAQIMAGLPVICLGALDAARDFTYVDDLADGLMRAATCAGVEGETIHLGSGQKVTMAALARRMAALAGREAVPVVLEEGWQRPERSEVGALCADAGRARRLLDWMCQVSPALVQMFSPKVVQ